MHGWAQGACRGRGELSRTQSVGFIGKAPRRSLVHGGAQSTCHIKEESHTQHVGCIKKVPRQSPAHGRAQSTCHIKEESHTQSVGYKGKH